MLILNKDNFSWKALLKWSLMVFVLLFILLNYFGAIQIAGVFLKMLDIFLKNHGYYLEISSPFFFIFKLVIPSVALVGYVVNLNNKNISSSLQGIYDIISISQLLLLLILLPILLFIQNGFLKGLMNRY